MKTEMTVVRELVDRGMELRAAMEGIKEELDGVEAALEGAALQGDQVPLADEDREGMQFLARGTESVVPVVLTADSIAASFGDGSAQHGRCEAVAGEKLGMLYRRKIVWECLAKGGKALRRDAVAALGAEEGTLFVEAAKVRDKRGLPKSSVRVEWKRAEDVEK